MIFHVNRTQDGIISYPMHQHSAYEVMQYIEGEGFLKTDTGDLPFLPGTIIIVPPGMRHGSVSRNGFVNISICGYFEHLLHANQPIVLSDTEDKEGETLAQLLYRNRHQDTYSERLYAAYTHFLLQHLKVTDDLSHAVGKVIDALTTRFYESDLSPSRLFRESGYAEDYIRAHFKKMTGKTPLAFLNEIRVTHASFLMEVYAGSLSLSEIAEKCGFTDYVYFSRRFKEVFGTSPREYRGK
ncbi:MAG: helix-turn-helix transcriptional regulator [Clostridia bacterium]|nr:helix-turn-helix transcriptional regulator [Clostridia bacterium]